MAKTRYCMIKKDTAWSKKDTAWSKKDTVWSIKDKYCVSTQETVCPTRIVWPKQDNAWSKKDTAWPKKDTEWSKKDTVWSIKDKYCVSKEETVWPKQDTVLCDQKMLYRQKWYCTTKEIYCMTLAFYKTARSPTPLYTIFSKLCTVNKRPKQLCSIHKKIAR